MSIGKKNIGEGQLAGEGNILLGSFDCSQKEGVTLKEESGVLLGSFGCFQGKAGITPHIGENGNWFLGEEDTGFPSRGEIGPQGEKGDTPEVGVDYFTEEDKQEIITQVAPLVKIPSALPNPHALTINGQKYDGSEAIEIEIKADVATNEEIIEMFRQADMLPACSDADGALLADENENVLLW